MGHNDFVPLVKTKEELLMYFKEAYIQTLIESLRRQVLAHPRPESFQDFQWDSYIAKSLLQKAIRRGKTGSALSAATFLISANERSFWQRLVVIACEDIGIANLDLVSTVCIVAGSKKLQDQFGGSLPVANVLVPALCASSKDRSTDDLFEIITRSRSLSVTKAELAELERSELFKRVTSSSAKIEEQFLAAIIWTHGSDIPEAFGHRFKKWQVAIAGVGSNSKCNAASVAAELGLLRSNVILAAMLPFLAARKVNGPGSVTSDGFPPETDLSGLPSWVLNGHTRAGKRAFSSLLTKSSNLKRFIYRHRTGEVTLVNIVSALVFHLESGCVDKRLQWPVGQRLRTLAESIGYGLPDECVPEARSLLLAEFDLLNECRAECLAVYLR
jgi:hypothetical protein